MNGVTVGEIDSDVLRSSLGELQPVCDYVLQLGRGERSERVGAGLDGRGRLDLDAEPPHRRHLIVPPPAPTPVRGAPGNVPRDEGIWFRRLPPLHPGETKLVTEGPLAVEGPWHPHVSGGERELARLAGSVTLRGNGAEVARATSEILVTDVRLTAVMRDGGRSSPTVESSSSSSLAAFVVPWKSVESITVRDDGGGVELRGGDWSMTVERRRSSRRDLLARTAPSVTNRWRRPWSAPGAGARRRPAQAR